MKIKVLLAAMLTSTMLLTPAWASTPKPGSTCKTLGTVTVVKNQKFTCVKSGRKLVWGKPTAIKANPKPSAPVALTLAQKLGLKPIEKWSMKLSSLELGNAAQLEFVRWVEKQSAATVQHKVTIEGNPDPYSLSGILSGDKTVSSLFSQFIPGGSFTVIGDNGDKVLDRASQLGISMRSEAAGGCRAKTWNFTYCINNNNFVGFTVGGAYRLDLRQPGPAGLPAHEYFHNVQSSLSGTPGEIRNAHPQATKGSLFPVWFTEGTADFVGYAVVAQNQGVAYSSFKDSMMSRPTDLDPNRNALEDYTYRVGSGNGTVMYPYNVGRVAVEYLVASNGFESVLNVFSDFKQTQNFEQSFRNVYGISVQDFYLKFEAIRTQIGLPPVTMVLVGETNMPKS